MPIDPSRLEPFVLDPLPLDSLSLIIDEQRDPDDAFLVLLPGYVYQLLICLNPRKLAVCADPRKTYPAASDDQTVTIVNNAASAMSGWTRLRSVHLDNVNLLMSVDEDGDLIEDEAEGSFFLSRVVNNLREIDIV